MPFRHRACHAWCPAAGIVPHKLLLVLLPESAERNTHPVPSPGHHATVLLQAAPKFSCFPREPLHSLLRHVRAGNSQEFIVCHPRDDVWSTSWAQLYDSKETQPPSSLLFFSSIPLFYYY